MEAATIISATSADFGLAVSGQQLHVAASGAAIEGEAATAIEVLVR